MRIQILTPEYDSMGGGIATYYRALASEFCKLGLDVRVIEGSGASCPSAFQRLLDEAVRGNVRAQYAVGGAYFNGKGVARNPAQGAQWLLRAAKAGYPTSWSISFKAKLLMRALRETIYAIFVNFRRSRLVRCRVAAPGRQRYSEL
jgi:hypothetical protein